MSSQISLSTKEKEYYIMSSVSSASLVGPENKKESFYFFYCLNFFHFLTKLSPGLNKGHICPQRIFNSVIKCYSSLASLNGC